MFLYTSNDGKDRTDRNYYPKVFLEKLFITF